jgi:hypothetical protein
MFDPARIRKAIAEQDIAGIRLVTIILEYAALILYFAFLWLNAGTESSQTAQYIGDLIFTQFFGQFVTIMLAIQIGNQHHQVARWILVLVYGGLGLWIMLDLTDGWLVTVVWMVSLAIGLMRDRDNVLGNALAEGGWLMVAGFIAAFVGSMAGIPEESLLLDHIGTTASWGILYYTGLLLTEWYTATQDDGKTV